MISARVHYAALALTELAIRRASRSPVAASEISERHGIPGPFLMQILRDLRGLGWVQSVRGSQGGYRLLVDPAELSLLEIAEAVGCAEASVSVGKADVHDAPAADAMLHGVWKNAAAASREILSRTKLSEIAARSTQDDEVMFYI